MKRLMLTVVAVMALGCTAAIAVENPETAAQTEISQQGWETIRERVRITTFTGNGHMKTVTTAGPLQQNENGSLRIFWGNKSYSVSRSNREGFKYMFYTNNTPHYFN